jgi:hypothetical protein
MTLTPYERAVIAEWLPRVIAQKPSCRYAGAKVRGAPNWHCALARDLSGNKVYLNCLECVDGSAATFAAVAMLAERIEAGSARTCCGGPDMPLAVSLAKLAALDRARAESAVVNAVARGTLTVDQAMRTAAEAGLALDAQETPAATASVTPERA